MRPASLQEKIMLTSTKTHSRLTPLRLAALCGGLMFAAVSHADVAPDMSAKARYDQERAACMRGHTYEDQKTCLREAGAAYDVARRGQLAGPSDTYQRNALQRCNNLPQKDRVDCVARIQGDSTSVSGSVGGGGVIRERVTTEPVRDPAQQN
jgi:uncharacterized protein YfaQ (DUF2300 family)